MGPRHGLEINDFLFAVGAGTLAGIVAEAVLDADDNPALGWRQLARQPRNAAQA